MRQSAERARCSRIVAIAAFLCCGLFWTSPGHFVLAADDVQQEAPEPAEDNKGATPSASKSELRSPDALRKLRAATKEYEPLHPPARVQLHVLDSELLFPAKPDLNLNALDTDVHQTYKYVGNSFSSKFHRPSCPFARAMNPRHIVHFPFRRDAVAQGHKPCRYCLPPDWLTVRAVLKAPASVENH